MLKPTSQRLGFRVWGLGGVSRFLMPLADLDSLIASQVGGDRAPI